MKQPRVLVIDDEKNFIEWVAEVLTAAGYTVSTAVSGREGIALAEHEKPDIIMLDIRMPDMDGFDVLRSLKDSAVTMSIPVIMLTALTSHEARMQALHLYCEGYVEKPCTAETVLSKIHAVLKRRQELQKRFV